MLPRQSQGLGGFAGCRNRGCKGALDGGMGHKDMAPDAHHRAPGKRARMPPEQTSQHRGFTSRPQRRPRTCLCAAAGHARHHGSAAHEQIMHRIIQRIYLSAERLQGRVGSGGGRGLIVHAGPILRRSNNAHMAIRQAPLMSHAKVAPGGRGSVKALS